MAKIGYARVSTADQHVEKQAARILRRLGLQIILSRGEGVDAQPHRAEQALQALANRLIVVDDGDV